MSDPPKDEFRRFERLAKRLVAVPKKEVDRRRALYESRRKRKLPRTKG